jgi:histidinol dehydrogenase
MREGLKIKVWDSKELPADWFKRQKADEKATLEVENSVKAIVNQVRADGDGALVELALKFDKAELKKPTTKLAPNRSSP